MTPPDPESRKDQQSTIHASCVALEGRAVLIRGASGSGKSALALHLVALGCGLVSDDRTCLWRDGVNVMANAPDSLRGKIEARGVGILNTPPCGPSPVTLVVDMDKAETQRLPTWREETVRGVKLPLLWKPEGLHFPAAIMLYLKHGRFA